MRVLYNLSEFGATGNGADSILTAAKQFSRHMACFDFFICSLKLFRLALVTFGMSPDTSCPAALVVLASDHHPIENQRPHSVLMVDMSVRVCQGDGYRLTCQSVTSITSTRLRPSS
ncbi:hypothetical protein AMTRI_Chr02g217000 [Amborella trichopoda]